MEKIHSKNISHRLRIITGMETLSVLQEKRNRKYVAKNVDENKRNNANYDIIEYLVRLIGGHSILSRTFETC